MKPGKKKNSDMFTVELFGSIIKWHSGGWGGGGEAGLISLLGHVHTPFSCHYTKSSILTSQQPKQTT